MPTGNLATGNFGLGYGADRKDAGAIAASLLGCSKPSRTALSYPLAFAFDGLLGIEIGEGLGCSNSFRWQTGHEGGEEQQLQVTGCFSPVMKQKPCPPRPLQMPVCCSGKPVAPLIAALRRSYAEALRRSDAETSQLEPKNGCVQE